MSYHRMADRLERREEKLLRGGGLPGLSAGGLEEKIPPAVRQGLETAFQKAFALLLGPGGTGVLKRTYGKKKLEEAQRLWSEGLSPGEARRTLRRMERQGAAARAAEVWAAGLEGTALGLLGIGLPDIPLFLGLLLRSLYQSAARYGFSPESPEERAYLLLVLQTALAQGEERRALSRRADQLGRALDHGWPVSAGLEEETRAAAALLSRRLLVLKFVQGIPLAGAVGGPANLLLSREVSRWGAMKYRKRFLEKKVRGL